LGLNLKKKTRDTVTCHNAKLTLPLTI